MITMIQNKIQYDEPILYPDGLKSSSAIEYEELMKTLAEHRFMQIFPNPAKDYFIIEYDLETEFTDVVLRIRDLKGHIVKQVKLIGSHDEKTINTQKLSTGIYFAALLVNGEEVDNVKLTVIK